MFECVKISFNYLNPLNATDHNRYYLVLVMSANTIFYVALLSLRYNCISTIPDYIPSKYISTWFLVSKDLLYYCFYNNIVIVRAVAKIMTESALSFCDP